MSSCVSFSQQRRLLNAVEYTAVFDKGKRYALSAGLYIVLATEQSHARLGLVVAKKHLNKAVRRNHLKRCQREAFRLSQARLPACDVVFLAHHRVAKLTSRQIQLCCVQDWLKLSAVLSA